LDENADCETVEEEGGQWESTDEEGEETTRRPAGEMEIRRHLERRHPKAKVATSRGEWTIVPAQKRGVVQETAVEKALRWEKMALKSKSGFANTQSRRLLRERLRKYRLVGPATTNSLADARQVRDGAIQQDEGRAGD
jgi:hypothetical protein